MNLTELDVQVRELVDDPAEFKWSKTAFAFEATRASVVIADALNFPAERDTSLSLVAGQREYLLPADISNVVALRIIPENDAEPPFTLTERIRAIMPVIDDVSILKQDPRFFTLISGTGATENQLTLQFDQAPTRSAPNAIVIDYQIKYDFDPAGDFSLQFIPFPTKFEGAMMDMTSGFLLQRADDSVDIERGKYLENKAREALAEYSMMNSLSYWEDQDRAFP